MPHQRIRPFTMARRYPSGSGHDIDFDLCMAVRAGNRVFLRGQAGRSLDGVWAGDDPADQARQAMENVKALLTEAGSDISHVCKTTIYVTDRAYREPVYAAIAPYFKGIHPCSTGLIVNGLALAEMKMEIDVEAVIPD